MVIRLLLAVEEEASVVIQVVDADGGNGSSGGGGGALSSLEHLQGWRRECSSEAQDDVNLPGGTSNTEQAGRVTCGGAL